VRIALAGAFVLVLAALCVLSSGCAVTYTLPNGGELGAYTGLAPSDEVQTVDMSVVGISVDATRQSLDIGYKKIRQTRIPAFDRPSLIPSVLFSTTVESDGLTDRLEVKEKP
jgi:hypothetical protein